MTSSRLVTLKEAAALVPDDAVVALGGFAIARNAIAFVNELIRQGRRGLTVTQTIVGMETDLLVGAGCVERLVYGGGSLDRFGQVACIGRAVESGAIRWESYSTLTMTLRYLAGGLGIPFIPTKSLLQSDVLRSLEAAAPDAVRSAQCPFTAEPVVLLRALQPDFAIVCVQQADDQGNYVIQGATWDNHEMVAAAAGAIVLAHSLVETDLLRQVPDAVHWAANAAAVVHVPWAAYPTALYRVHDYDANHIRLYAAHARTPDGFAAYLAEYVLGTQDHDEYVAKGLGTRRRESMLTYG